MFLLFGEPDAGKPRPDGLLQAEAVHVVVGGQTQPSAHFGNVVVELVVVVFRWVVWVAQGFPVNLVVAERVGLQGGPSGSVFLWLKA